MKSPGYIVVTVYPGDFFDEKRKAFKMTYTTDENLYIAVGYGPQEGGGYSICVNELYLTGNSVVIATELKGPENGEDKGVESSSPYIVVKTELLDLPVVFQ